MAAGTYEQRTNYPMLELLHIEQRPLVQPKTFDYDGHALISDSIRSQVVGDPGSVGGGGFALFRRLVFLLHGLPWRTRATQATS